MNKSKIIYRYGHNDVPKECIVNDCELKNEVDYLVSMGAEILGTPDVE